MRKFSIPGKTRPKKVIVYVHIKTSQDDTVSSPSPLHLRRVIWRNAHGTSEYSRSCYIKKGERQRPAARCSGHRCYRGLEIKVSLRLEARPWYSLNECSIGVFETLTVKTLTKYIAIPSQRVPLLIRRKLTARFRNTREIHLGILFLMFEYPVHISRCTTAGT